MQRGGQGREPFVCDIRRHVEYGFGSTPKDAMSAPSDAVYGVRIRTAELETARPVDRPTWTNLVSLIELTTTVQIG